MPSKYPVFQRLADDRYPLNGIVRNVSEDLSGAEQDYPPTALMKRQFFQDGFSIRMEPFMPNYHSLNCCPLLAKRQLPRLFTDTVIGKAIMENCSPIRSNSQYFHAPSESRTSHSPTPAQQDSQKASTSSPGLRRDNPSSALQSALMELPSVLKVKVAEHLKDSRSIANLRLTCKDLSAAGTEAVKHVRVGKREDLQVAIETYKKGGITALTVNASLRDNDLLLLKNLPGLERLNLSKGYGLTNAGLAHLPSLTSLKRLDLSKCYLLTGEGLGHLRNLPSLEELNLDGFRKIDNAAVEHLEGITSLKRLRLAGCERLTNEEMEDLRNRLGNCEVTVVERRELDSAPVGC